MLRPPLLSGPRLAVLPTAAPAAAAAVAAAGPLFHALELDVYRPSLDAPVVEMGRLSRPRLALTQLPVRVEAHERVSVSDLGYRTPAGDPAAPDVVVYPPRLRGDIGLERELELEVNGAGAGAAWGDAEVDNRDGGLSRLGDMLVDGRRFRVLAGRKTWDDARGLWRDPPRAELALLFAGVAAGLEPAAGGFRARLRDGTYWLERPLQSRTYAGLGGLDGSAAMAGRPLPKTRGGTPARPVRSVAPVLVDADRRIWAYSDGPGGVVAVYEGGLAGGILPAGNVSDLTVGTVAPGYFRTDNARGLLQFGREPARAITLDVWGAFPGLGHVSTAGALARALLLDDLGVPSDLLDHDAFFGLDAARPWAAGRFWDGGQPVDGAAAVGELVASLGARLVPSRLGRLRPVLLRAPQPGEVPTAALTTTDIVDVSPLPLPESLRVPLVAGRVGYARNHAPSADLAATVSSAERQRLAAAWQYATAAGATGTLAAYRRPNLGAVLETALLDPADAGLLAADLAALWGQARRYCAVDVRADRAARLELGELVTVSYPEARLAGAVGRVVGESLRTGAGVSTLKILF